ACANVASVMLARALARRREMGIRLAIGASRGRLVAQLFVENLMLSALGGTLGLAMGYGALRALVAAMGTDVPAWTRFEIDVRVRHVEPGFRADHVFTFTMSLSSATYPNDAARLAFWRALQERAAILPGVESVGVVSCAPLGCHWGTFYAAEGASPRAPGQAN